MGNPPPSPDAATPRCWPSGSACSAWVVGELLVYTWVRVQWFQVGYEISNLTKEQQHLNELQANLKVELARLRAPQRIIRIAQEKAGADAARLQSNEGDALTIMRTKYIRLRILLVGWSLPWLSP